MRLVFKEESLSKKVSSLKENDLRYIQELLDYSIRKITEIYTHFSSKNIKQIKSPFEVL
jgi:site-specific recombinase XerD